MYSEKVRFVSGGDNGSILEEKMGKGNLLLIRSTFRVGVVWDEMGKLKTKKKRGG